jgi:hypothetical protein
MANIDTTPTSVPGSPSPAKDETRWTDEGGSNQHYRHDDEPQWRVFNRHEDRTWHRFDATYGKDFAETLKPHESDNQPRPTEEP